MGELLYCSERSWRGLWHRYLVYRDRVVLVTWLGKMVVPAAELDGVEVRPPLVVGDLWRGRPWHQALALKLDMADQCEHVALHRRTGMFRHLRFTPDEPERFVAACRMMRAA